MKITFKISGYFEGNFNLDIVVQAVILVHSLKKENRVNVKVNLGQIRLSVRKLHVTRIHK